MHLTSANITNFWRKVRKVGEEDCWEWTAYKNDRGYGQFSTSGNSHRKLEQASRVAYFLGYGEFDEKLFVCHHCDNPGCVNPKHLFLGTHTDNVRDMVAKNRHNPNRGEDSYKSILTEADVIKIRELYATGKYFQTDLGEMFGVHKSTISGVINRRRWNHV